MAEGEPASGNEHTTLGFIGLSVLFGIEVILMLITTLITVFWN